MKRYGKSKGPVKLFKGQSYLGIRMEAEDKRLLEAMASKKKIGLSEFIRTHLVKLLQ